MKVRRLGRRALIAGLAVAAGGLVVVVPGSPAGAVTLSNACINSAVPTDFSQVNVDMTATAPASVDPGESFQLTNISQTVALPGAIFVAGYNLGLLQVGLNTVPGTIRTTIEGTNTVEGTQTTAPVNISVTFTIADPDGTPGTGDETGTDASVTVTYPDQTWTAGPVGTIQFREDTVTPQSATVGGIVITAVLPGGLITVRFGCNPGTVLPGPPETIQLTDPAASFASTANTAGEGEPTTTTTTAPTTTTTAAPTTTTTVPSVPGSRTTVNACKSSVTGTYSDLAWTLGGKATFDAASNKVTLSESTVAVNIPPTLLVTAYNIGLLTIGPNGIPITVYVARSATDFLGAVTNQVDHFSITVNTTITDPDGVPSTGDESATPLAVSHDLPDMVATPAGGGVSFAQAAPGTIGSVPLGANGAPIAVGGSIFVQATVAAIKANFDCFPGTTIVDPPSTTSGKSFTPATPLPFVVLSLTGAAPPPLAAPPPAPEVAAAAANAPLARTGSDPLGPITFALGLLAAGVLAQAAAVQARRRRPAR
jgi:hypothetical protein